MAVTSRVFGFEAADFFFGGSSRLILSIDSSRFGPIVMPRDLVQVFRLDPPPSAGGKNIYIHIFSEPPYASNAHPTPKTREDTPF